jgi:hypothetical protein
MEYRGVRYEIKRGLGRGEWVWSVYTPEKIGNVSGDWTYATIRARRVIDGWRQREARPGREASRSGQIST